MANKCKNCGSSAVKTLRIEPIIAPAFIFLFGISIRIGLVLSFLGIIKKGKLLECKECSFVTSKCPRCNYVNDYNDAPTQLCQKCKKVYKNYV